MLRKIASVAAGYIAWSVLWLSANAALIALFPESYHEGLTTSTGILGTVLFLSVAISVAAGYLTTLIGRETKKSLPWIVGALLLATGIAVQASGWNEMPVWYHLSFLTLLIPGVLLGAALRTRSSVQTPCPANP